MQSQTDRNKEHTSIFPDGATCLVALVKFKCCSFVSPPCFSALSQTKIFYSVLLIANNFC